MAEQLDRRIKVMKDGPYLVTGCVPLAKQTIVCDAGGESADWQEGERYPDRDRYILCRCGKSATKPYCDGTHSRIGWDGTETASREAYADRAHMLEGPGMTITEVPDLCAEARYCAAAGAIWNTIAETGDPEVRDRVIRQCQLCPAGRYVAVDTATGEALEPGFEPSLGLVEDPEADVSGGIWVRGGIPVESADGFVYEVRNRVTLCRCGASRNKPFCDGAHCEIGFTDQD
jgi:CDGSH-type Zn-finger protein